MNNCLGSGYKDTENKFFRPPALKWCRISLVQKNYFFVAIEIHNFGSNENIIGRTKRM